jgi:signal transduction histidine kinase
VQESLANVRYHADAHRVAVRVDATDAKLEVSVEDDGRGFDPDHPVPAGIGRGVGLVSMRERAERLGGGLTVSSDHGRGCRVTLRVTLAEAAFGAHTNPAG